MFELKMLVEDKNLPKVMWALDGLVANMSPPVPVRGAEVKKANGTTQVVATNGGGSIQDRVAHAIANSGLAKITTGQFRQYIVDAGGNPSYIGTMRKVFADKKILKPEEKGVYKNLLLNH